MLHLSPHQLRYLASQPASRPSPPSTAVLSEQSQRPGHRLGSLEYLSRISPLLKAARTLSTVSTHMVALLVGNDAYRPPMKCLPSKNFTSGFAAVRLISASGLYLAPGPELGGPSSIFQDEGASTASTGVFVLSRADITERNGSRTSPLKLKPGED